MPVNNVELEYPDGVRVGVKSAGVKRVQEWLTLHGFSTGIDSEFGSGTLASLQAFQRKMRIDVADNVTTLCWSLLVAPLVKASSFKPDINLSFGDAAVKVADAYLQQQAREVGGDNRGPWVRWFCKGQDGAPFAWCQGFASSVWEQTARALGLEVPIPIYQDQYMSLWVPWMVQSAKKVGKYVDGNDVVAYESVAPGSMFFVRGGTHGHFHVGLLTGKAENDTFYTVEGNTNDDGSPNGYKVAARVRRRDTCDFAVL